MALPGKEPLDFPACPILHEADLLDSILFPEMTLWVPTGVSLEGRWVSGSEDPPLSVGELFWVEGSKLRLSPLPWGPQTPPCPANLPTSGRPGSSLFGPGLPSSCSPAWALHFAPGARTTAALVCWAAVWCENREPRWGLWVFQLPHVG